MNKSRSILLTYHDVYSRQVSPKIPRSASIYHVSEHTFLEHIEIIKSSDIQVTSISKIIPAYGETDSLGFTFDDGWAGIYHFILPLFKKLGWSATIFITRDFVDKPGFLSKSQVIELSNAGFEIGIHGTTHRMLSTCKPDDIRWELSTCKDFLERLTDQQVVYASLPGGDESPSITSIARQLGLQAVFTSRPGFNLSSTSPFAQKRIFVRASTTCDDIQRYCRYFVNRDILRWFIFQIPHKILGGKKYVYLRRWLLNETKEDGKNRIFDP